MSGEDETSELAAALGRLVAARVLPDRAQAGAEGLLRRMIAPIRAVICGPDSAACRALLEDLQGLPAADLALCAADDAFAADLVLWVTHDFAAAEQALWSRAPEALRDHAFLVALAPPCAPDARLIAHLEEQADELFCSLSTVAATGGPPRLADLSALLARHLNRCREASRDGAALLIANFGHLAPTAPPPAAESGILAKGPALIERAATDLADLPGDGADEAQSALDICAATGDALSALFGSAPGLPVSGMILTAADTLMLLALEATEAAATDAVTVILQLRKDIAQACHAGTVELAA